MPVSRSWTISQNDSEKSKKTPQLFGELLI